MWRRAAGSLIASCLFAACGGREAPPFQEGPVDFAYRMDDGAHSLGELRGRPAIVVLLRVNELTSELFIDEVAQAHDRLAGTTRFLVLSLDPNEAPMIRPYREFHELPFEVGIADWSVAQGSTGLGTIPIVPTTYFIDARGRVARAVAGVVPFAALEEVAASLGWR